MNHDDQLEAAKKAIDQLHKNLSVPLEETLISLQDLRDHIDILIDAVECSM